MIRKIFSFGFITWSAILALAGAQAYQFLYQDKSESSQVNHLVEANAKQQEALQQITQILNTHDSQFKQIAEHSNQLVASLKELDGYVHSDSNAWRLMQVQNFLGLAMTEATMLNDLPAAINLLVAADSILKSIQNPNVLPVRKAIQEDLAALSKNPASYSSDILLALDKIVELIPNFPHKIQFTQNVTETSNTTRAQSAWQEIKSLIRIRHHDQPITPYFSQDDIALINENLSLILNQAGFAAARHYSELYKNQIKQAQSWIKQYYDVNDPAVAHALATLAQLENVPVTSNSSLHLKTVDAWSAFVTTTRAGSK